MEAYKRTREAGSRVERVDEAWTGAGTQDSPIVLDSLLRDVSPPRKRKRPDAASTAEPPRPRASSPPCENGPLRSPFQLTAVRDVPASANVDTLTVKDVFGSPHLVECWEFNFLHDLEFLMSAVDEGAVSRGLQVHVVHGFSKHADQRRAVLEQDAERINAELAGDSQNGLGQDAPQRQCASITLHAAILDEPFGTHHAKMAVLFRDDEHVQIVIHTANMIPHDWTNTTQAVWRSPLLPLATDDNGSVDGSEPGVGNTFKKDFLSYLRAYDRYKPICRELSEKLVHYDFSAIQAVLIASVPGRHKVLDASDLERLDKTGATPTQWGWAAMKRALRNVPIQRPPVTTASGTVATGTAANEAEIVAQVSSIATLGGTDRWLRQILFAALGGGHVEPTPRQKQAQSTTGRVPVRRATPAQFRVVFPVADEIRRSLDGYRSGTSIHTKDRSGQQKQQVAYMNPIMCHWANDAPEGEPLPGGSKTRLDDSGRDRAAPHIKTYIRYAPDGTIDWALMTSANLSKQAWGEANVSTTHSFAFRIASYEMGVLVWPELLAAGATMQPVFQRDTLVPKEAKDAAGSEAEGPPVVPLRMPYSLPLQRYGKTEIPWVVSNSHSEPDWRGARWDAPEF